MPGYIFIREIKDRNMAGKKKKRGRKKIVLFVFEILLLGVLLGVLWLYNTTFGQVSFDDSDMTNTEAGINEDISEDTLKNMHGYLNVALFGLDNRSNGSYNEGNSDSIIIASLNWDTKEIQLVSLYRDTYLSSGNGKYTKANAAYASGGARRAVSMINSNLDLNIKKYVCVDWKALVDAIDGLGGLDLEITQDEVDEINYLLPEIDGTTGYETPEVESAGIAHLDGTQATAYARIRSTAGDDFLRASRQRIVLQAMLDKAQDVGVASLINMCQEMFKADRDENGNEIPKIATNFSQDEIIKYAPAVIQCELKSTTGFPFELTSKMLSSTGDTVIPIDLAQNVSELHEYLFNEGGYVPSETVQKTSRNIEDKTGVDSSEAAYDLDKFNDTVGSDGTEGVKKKNELKNPKSTEQDVDSDDGDSDSDDRDSDSDEEQNDREGNGNEEEY